MDEYVVMNKSDLTTMANSIRDALGSTDSIAVGDLANKLIEAIEAGGGGGNITAGTITPLTANAVKVEHGLGATPQAVIFFAAADPNVISGKYDEAPIGHIIPSKNAISIRWFCYRGRMQSGNISIAGTKGLWGNGTTNTVYDRINNINDVYFMTPSNCDACTYLWVSFKEPLV